METKSSGNVTSASSVRSQLRVNMITSTAAICTMFTRKYGTPSQKNQ